MQLNYCLICFIHNRQTTSIIVSNFKFKLSGNLPLKLFKNRLITLL